MSTLVSPTHLTGTTLLPLSPLPEAMALNEILRTMRGALGALGVSMDSLGEHTARVGSMAPAMENAHQIQSLAKQMIAQDERQASQVEEIKQLLKDVLKDDIVNHLKNQIAKQITAVITDEVRKGVAEELNNKYIPDNLQDEVVGHKRQLEEVRRALHNSESRRANALLRSSHIGERLHTLLMSNGKVSDKFPPDLSTLFALDGETCKQLMEDYELTNITDSRERNLNHLMVFIGVAYKMVPAGSI